MGTKRTDGQQKQRNEKNNMQIERNPSENETSQHLHDLIGEALNELDCDRVGRTENGETTLKLNGKTFVVKLWEVV